MHLGAPADLVDDLFIEAHRKTHELCIVRCEFRKNLSIGRIVTRCEHLFDVS